MKNDARIYVAGHRGLVGAAIVRRLRAKGFENLLLRTSAELDLRDERATDHFFAEAQPQYVFMAAARVGGILANSKRPVDFLRDNLRIELNTIDSAARHGVPKLLFLGSSCIYPKHAEQPIAETSLLTGPLEPTNEWYAIAKIAGIKLCQAYGQQQACRFISAMPTNVYGPGDNFDLESSHVLPALLRKIHEASRRDAPTVEVWGSGKPRREFIHCDDLAEACLHLMLHYDELEPINIGTGTDITIAELAHTIADVVGYGGELAFDTSRPDGTPRKLLDVSRLASLGWRSRIGLRAGIESTYAVVRDELDGLTAARSAEQHA